ncbi:MAG TPA: ABC transporter permease [Rugosimonospora sp.]|nr:ABC transporter permease [Rugosimonospora sp.]
MSTDTATAPAPTPVRPPDRARAGGRLAWYALRRLLHMAGVVWAVATIVFFLVNVIGNPAALMLPPDATQEQVDQLTHDLGLDRPLLERYWDYISGLAHGNFGESLWLHEPVLKAIGTALVPSLALTSVTMLVTFFLAVLLGTLAAARQNGIVDKIVSGVAFVAVSVPDFWVGLLLVAAFAVRLRWVPTSGYGAAAYFVLPVLTLMTRPLGRILSTTRSSLIEELGHEHIATALAKGLARPLVLVRHGLRNSLITSITLTGDEVANLIGGAVVVETIFAWPGMGRLSLQAIQNRDLNLVIGLTVVTALFVLVTNLLLEMSYRFLDPRIRRRR